MYEKGMGVSVYLGKNPIEKDIEYICLAKKFGFYRVFTCFLGLEKINKDEFLHQFKLFTKKAKEINMQVYVDVSPMTFKLLNASYDSLSVFEELNITGIRLDEGFSGLEESLMAFGKLKIEINASNGTKYLDNILSFQPNKNNLIACHNFYPRKFTGLSLDYFNSVSMDIKNHNIKLAAFVASLNEASFSNQSVMEGGLPTLEHHRNNNIVFCAKELYYLGLIDDVIIGNAYATQEELKMLSVIDKDIITFDIKLVKGLSDFYTDMLLNNLHFNRGDVSEFVIRSTMLRIKYRDKNISPFNTVDINIGDITVDNDLYLKYKGELHIARKNMLNSGKTNVIAKIVDSELGLIKYIKPWTKFKFNIV